MTCRALVPSLRLRCEAEMNFEVSYFACFLMALFVEIDAALSPLSGHPWTNKRLTLAPFSRLLRALAQKTKNHACLTMAVWSTQHLAFHLYLEAREF